MRSMFKRNLLVAFGISMLLLMISSAASYSGIRNLLGSARLVSHTHEVLAGLQHVTSLLKDAETAQRGYLLAGDEAYLIPYGTASDDALAGIAHVKTLTLDDGDQQVTVLELRAAAINRLKQLQKLIDIKKKGVAIQPADLVKGRQYMDEAMRIIDVMKNREENLLKLRTGRLNLFSTFTPYLILAIAFISFVMAIVSYIHLSKEMEHRVSLQQGLEHREEVTRVRLSIIQDIAEKIAAGHYSTRVNGEEEEKLGNVAASLNKMAASLEYSFGLISDKEWLQTGIAGLHNRIMREYDPGVLVHKTLAYITEYTGSRVGAYYQAEGQMLKLAGGYALMHDDSRKTLQMGEGLAGQCAASGKMMVLEELPAKHILISFAAGNLRPFSVAAVPVVYEGTVIGVMELGSLKRYSSADEAFLEAAANAAGIAITAVENRRRIIQLLEETKAQARELQEQQHELQSINEELEAQAQKLQASEEELRVQQEELMEANQELEERSRQLEEKNQVIHERNISIQGKAEELATASRYKSEFLANMSHELRTPLNSILLLSRLMKENKDKSLTREQVENAGVILSSGQGLLYLIDEILDLSRIEAGRMDLHYEPASVQGMLDDLRVLFAPVAREKGVALHMHVHDHVPATIETDRLRLLQVLRNLLSNALKFTSSGSVSLDVQPLSASGMISLTVKDTGIGIPADKQHMIFEAFQQADGSTHRKYGGTGLGLSISRELVRLMGGYIQLESRQGEGSAFTVCIPPLKTAIHQAGPPAAGEAPPPSPPEQEIKTGDRLVTGIIPKNIPDDRELVRKDDKIILIVEDDTAFARTLLGFTHARGYKGIVAVRGDEALTLAKEHRPLGILLDIRLPVKDGWEVMEELKKDPLTRHIPVHVMSSYEARTESISRGAIDFVNKPLTPVQMEQVFHRIEHLLSNNSRKVLIVEENTRHAKALSYFLESSNVNTEIRNSVGNSIDTLKDQAVNCVILDMGASDTRSYNMLEEVKSTPGLENIHIIIFTGRNLSRSEELHIRQYADSIVIKTAHSYQRILDEVSLFLHLMERQGHDAGRTQHRTAGALEDVLKGKTVLVADDDVRNIYSLTRALESAGMHVISAIDGREALRQMEQHPQVNIVLMDMMMPEMDGFESIRRIRSGSVYANIPVIAVTAKAMTGDRQKCIDAGASDYITKPVDMDQLLSLLRVWLYDTSKR